MKTFFEDHPVLGTFIVAIITVIGGIIAALLSTRGQDLDAAIFQATLEAQRTLGAPLFETNTVSAKDPGIITSTPRIVSEVEELFTSTPIIVEVEVTRLVEQAGNLPIPTLTNVPTRITELSSAEAIEGLVAYFPFDSSINDVSKNNLVGNEYGGEFSADRFGNANSAYKFDGFGDHIRYGDTLNDVNIPFTISAWIWIEKPYWFFTSDDNILLFRLSRG